VRPAFSGDYLSRRWRRRAPGEGDTLAGIENLQGSPYNEVLIANSASNEMTGCGGSDRLNGLAGNDTLRGDGIGCGRSART
jgi:Ca2+-binding RTX toxin-like protein